MTDLIRPRIVVGIAEEQHATLRYAIDEARRFDLDLEVVHCAGYVSYSTRALDRMFFETWAEAAEHVLRWAQRTVEREFEPPRCRYRMSVHGPFDELLQAGTEAAEIVVGSDNPAWHHRMLGPGISQLVARTATCPVVVVPEDQLDPPRVAGVVLGFEGSRPDEHVLRYGFEQADRRRCELTMVHALPDGAWIGEAEAHQAAVVSALSTWNEKFPDVVVHRKFIEGPPTRAVLRAARSAELVVVGQPGPNLLPFELDRPLGHGLLSQARCPVAVIPDVFA